MIKKIKYNKNPHQRKFHNDVTSKRLHLSSGFGAGKTHALCMKSLQLSALNKHLPGGLMCPSLVEFKKDVLPLMEEICDENKIPLYFNKQDYYFLFPWSKSKLYVVSGEKKIRGPNWAYACINELTLIPLVRYKEVIGRVRLKKARYLQVASVGTPEGMANEYYDYMIENPRQGFTIIYGDTRDNLENITEDYVENLEESYDSVMQDAYLRGLWVNMAGNRFYYAYDPKRNDNKDIKQDPYSVVHVGLDFNVDPMAATCWNFDGKRLKAFDEITLKDADTRKMGEALIKRGYGPDESILYPDPSGNSRSTKGDPDIKILERMGFYEIRVKRKAPGMRTRQLNVNNLLEKGVIQLNPDKCQKLKKDLMAVEQDPGTKEKIKKNKELTHHSDGVDYMCDILFPFSGSKPRSRIERIR